MVFDSTVISISVLAGPICMVNLAFMFMLYKKGSLKRLKNGLLFSLACSDFCTGSITIPLIVFSSVNRRNTPCAVHKATYLITRLITMSSGIHLLAVVYERFLKIMYPFWFNTHEMTLLRSERIVQGIWYTSLLISIIPLSWLYSESCSGPSNNNYTIYYDYAYMAFILVILLLMVIAFARIFFVVRAHIIVIRAIAVPPNWSPAGGMTSDLHDSGSGNGEIEEDNDRLNATSSHEHSIARTSSRSQSDPRILGKLNQKSRRYWFIKEARIVVRFAAMVFIFAFVWVTVSVISMLEQEGGEVTNLHFVKVFSVIRYLTSLLNPLIVTVNNQDFQSTWAHFSSCLYRVLGCCCPQSQPSPTNTREAAVGKEREIPLICTNTV